MKLLRAALIFLVTVFLSEVEARFILSISPLGRNVVLEPNDDLNLTCRVMTRERINIRRDLSWKLPTRSNYPAKNIANGDRVTVYQKNDQLTITIHSMQEEDSGFYVCSLQDNGIIWTKKINVFVRSKKCSHPFFDCGGGLCISRHYLCDGYIDCPTALDEIESMCGNSPCSGKLLCDGRCISKHLCCDPTYENNCTANYLMPCCPDFVPQKAGEINNPPTCPPNEDCHFGHYLGFGNSILYIVASCAGVVMVVSTVIMFLACRICSKQSSELQRRWAADAARDRQRRYLPGVSAHRDSDSTDNMDFLFDDINSDPFQGGAHSGSETTNEDFVMVNFVPGLGYQIAECGPKPPPYTENVVGIPPPPYQSTVDLSEANKNTETDRVAPTENNE